MFLKSFFIHFALLLSCSLALPLSQDEGASTPEIIPSNSNSTTSKPDSLELDTTSNTTTTEAPTIHISNPSEAPLNLAADSLPLTTTTSSPISSTTLSPSGPTYISIGSHNRTATKAASQNTPSKISKLEDDDDEDSLEEEEEEEDDDDDEEKAEKLKASLLFLNGNAAPWISDETTAID